MAPCTCGTPLRGAALLVVAVAVAVAPFPARAHTVSGERVPGWAAAFTDGAVLQRLVDDAIASGKGALEIPAGNYSFGAPARPLVISGASGLRISGEGPFDTSLWFAPGFGVEVLSSVNLTLERLSIDCLTPPHSQGKLVSLDPQGEGLVVDIEEGFPLPDFPGLFNSTCPDGSPGRCSEIKVVYWDPATRRMVQDQQMNNPMAGANCSAATRRCRVKLLIADPQFYSEPGALVTFSPRMWAGKTPIPTYYRGTFLVFNCTGAVFQDIDTYGAADMVWVENLGGGGNVYRRTNIKRRANPPYTPRLLAANDDGFHSMSVEHGPTVQGCEFGFIADDFINVHNRLFPLLSLNRATRTASVMDVGDVPGHGYTGPRPAGSGANGHITHTMGSVAPGDALKLYAADTHELLGVLVVASARWVNSAGEPAPPLPKALAPRVEADGVQQWEIVYDERASTPPAAPIANYSALVQIDRFSSFGARVEGNHFHDSYNNVGRFAASNLVFKDNVVERCDDGIHVSYDIASSFLEGSLGMVNISFVGNTFRSVRGCGINRHGELGCNHTCTNMTCVLSHVDPGLVGQVSARGNSVVA